jgi:hypothetical protein
VARIDPDDETIDRFAAALVAEVRHFKLYCGRCWTSARDPRRWIDDWAYDPGNRGMAATHFFSRGWRHHGTVLCPRCAKLKRTQTARSEDSPCDSPG